MRAAELRLRELAEEGDASAEEAIAQVNVPELLWNAAYAYIESVAEEELEKVQQEGDEVEVNLKKSRKARECEEPLYGGDWDAQDFEDQQVPKFRTSQEDLYPKSEQAVLDILIKACKSVDACAGLQKLEECVAALELSQHFNCNERPPTLERDDDILAYLGQQDASPHEAGPLIAGWRAYASSWKKPKETLSPRAVCIFWRTYKDGSNPSLKALGALALKEFSRPISAACCERVFSYLTQMDTPDRATMGKKTLQMLLFLRGNWHLVHDMVDEEYAADVIRRAAIAQVHKRRREAVQGEEAEATAAAAAAAATAAMEEDAEDSQEDRGKLELAAEEIVAAAAAKAAKDSSEGSDSGSQDSGREFYDNE